MVKSSSGLSDQSRANMELSIPGHSYETKHTELDNHARYTWRIWQLSNSYAGVVAMLVAEPIAQRS